MNVRSIKFALLMGFLLSSALSLVTLRTVIFSPGLVEWGDLTFHYQISKLRSYNSYTWNSYISVDNGWSMPFSTVNFLSMLVNSTEIFQRLTLFLIFTLLGLVVFVTFFAWSIEKYQNVGSCYVGSLTAFLIYALNPWVANRVGHYAFLWGYAFIPLLFYFTPKAIDQSSTKEALKYSLIVSLVLFLTTGSYTIFFICSFFVASLAVFEVSLRIRERGFAHGAIYLRNGVILVSVAIGVTSLLFAYYLLPYVFTFAVEYSRGPFWRMATPDVLNWLSSQSNMFNVIRLSGYWWTDGLFGVDGWVRLIWILSTLMAPILGFLAVILRPKDKTVLTLSIVAVVAIFLGKGVNEPLGNFYSWLVLNGPLSSLALRIGIHDPDRWTALLVFSYAFLSATAIAEIWNKMHSGKRPQSRHIDTRNETAHRSRIMQHLNRKSTATIFLVLLLFFSAVFSAFPLLTGDLRGHITPIPTPSSYDDLNKWLTSQEDEYRAYWLPQWAQFDWMNRGIDPQAPLWLSSKPVLYYGSPYTNEYLNFINEVLVNNRTKNLGKLTGMLNTKYVIFHNDTAEDFTSLYEILLKQNDLKMVYEKDFLSVFASEYVSPYIFSLDNIMYLQGGFDSLLFLSSIRPFTPGEWAILFMDRKDELNPMTLNSYAEKSVLVFFGADSSVSFLHENSEKMSYLLNDSKTRIVYVANSSYLSRSVDFLVPRSSRYMIAFRGNSWSDFDRLTVAVNNQTLTQNLANATKDSEWFYVGPIKLDNGTYRLGLSRTYTQMSSVIVQPMGWIFSIEEGGTAWRLLSPDEASDIDNSLNASYYDMPAKIRDFITTYQTKPENAWGKVVLIPDVVLFSIDEGEETSTLDEVFGGETRQPLVDYERLNPSEATVRVNATEPFILVYSEAYHEFWDAYTGDTHYEKIRPYSLLNGFLINRTGSFEIKLEFRAEKYFRLGLIISFLTLPLVIFAVVVLDEKLRKSIKSLFVRARSSTAVQTASTDDDCDSNLVSTSSKERGQDVEG